MKKGIVLFCFISLAITLYAQERMLSMEDALVKNRSTLAPSNLKQLQFIYGTSDYVYLSDDGQQWMKGGFNSADESLLTVLKLNTLLEKNGYPDIKSMPAIQFNKSKEWTLTIAGNKLAIDPVSGKIRTLIEKSISGKENVEESKAGFVAYLDNYNLYVARNQSSKQVTSDGSTDIVYASSVHREEFGITKGTFWSNNGKLLAFYRMDQSMVTDYPIIDWSVKPAKSTNIKYPMAGDKSHHVTLGVYNAETQAVTWIKTGEPAEQYLTNIAWSPDDKYVYIAVLNRGQDHLKLNQYDAASGDFIKTLFEESDDKYVEPLVPMLFVDKHPGEFIWQSTRDGWNHLYLYNSDGKLIKQLTSGEWEVTEVKGFDREGENLFYVSTAESPLSRNLYKLNIESRKVKRITDGNGVHNTQVNSEGSLVIDNMNNSKIPRAIYLIDPTANRVKTLLIAPNPLADYTLGTMNIFTLNSHGNLIFCRVYKPVHFDSLKKYPAIAYWYGGSHAQLITDGWNGGASDYWFQAMAERGFVVYTIDTRGSDNRGKAFEQAMFRRIGDVQMEDMKVAVDYFRRLSYIDASNMGLFGWSFGGFNTIDYMLHYPTDFKAAVAGGPVTDWKYYEVMYTERYMDTPQENPDGYNATDLTQLIGNLKGKLLLIHGLQDNTVVQQNSVRLVRAAIDKNIQVDYMIYPGHEHNVQGKDRAHLYEKVTDYFVQNLVR